MSVVILPRPNYALYTFCKRKSSAAYSDLMKSALITPSTAEDVIIRTRRTVSTGKSPTKMRAWQIHQYGGKEELQLSDTARAATIKGPNELLIKVHAASINPIDTLMRGGYASKALNILRKQSRLAAGSEFPLTLGRDFSGVVETGRAVRKYKPGDEVWGALNGFRQGTHAQFTIASESEISKKPRGLSHAEAASIPYVAATTWTALSTVGEFREKNALGKRVLIQGGSGGIGTFAVQLLKAWGADVTATCSTDAVDMLHSLGADTVVDYKIGNVTKELSRLPPFDFVLDGVGGKTTDDSFGLLKKWTNAKLVSLVVPLFRNVDSMGLVPGTAAAAFSLGSNIFRGLTGGQSYRWAFFLPNAKALDRVRQLVESGQIRPVIEKEFSFSDMPAAFENVEKGHNRGKTVDHEGLEEETLELSVAITDQFLARAPVTVRQVQLVGVTALLIAAKYIERFPPMISTLCSLTAGTYNTCEVLEMEKVMLSVLQFDVSFPVPIVFLRRFLFVHPHDVQVEQLARYLLDLSLPSQYMVSVLPSMLAASALYVARKVWLPEEPEVWTPALVHYTGYRPGDIVAVIRMLASMLLRAGISKYQCIVPLVVIV